MRANILPSLPSASAQGVNVGDVVVVNNTPPEVYLNTVNGAGARAWTQLSPVPGLAVPTTIAGPTFVAGAPASATVTASGQVLDQNGNGVQCLLEFVISGVANNLAAAAPATGTTVSAMDLAATSSRYLLRTDVTGNYNVALTWGAAEAAQWAVTAGNAAAVSNQAFP